MKVACEQSWAASSEAIDLGLSVARMIVRLDLDKKAVEECGICFDVFDSLLVADNALVFDTPET